MAKPQVHHVIAVLAMAGCAGVRPSASLRQVRKLPVALCQPAIGALEGALKREGYRIDHADAARGVLAASTVRAGREAFVNVTRAAGVCELRATFFEREPFDLYLESGREIADPALYLRLFGRLGK